MVPILRERMALADSLSRLLGQLGLERVAVPMPSLSEYISARTDPAPVTKPEEPEAQ